MTPPRLTMARGQTRVAHREYLGDITGSTDFAIAHTVQINPGVASAFPWLAFIARQYESYYVRSLTFEYETQESTATAGTVMLAVDYDAADVPPASKAQLLSYKGATRTPGWAPMKFHCTMPEMVVHGAGKYVRSSTLAAGLDIKMYDVGKFYLATQGFAATTVAGELYVSYVIDFLTPQSDPTAIIPSLSAKATGNGSVSVLNVFGTAATILGDLAVTAAAQTMTFNSVGEYLIAFTMTGTALTNVTPTMSGTSTHKLAAGLYANAGATAGTFVFQVRATAPGQTLILDPAASATTVTGMTARIGLYSYGY